MVCKNNIGQKCILEAICFENTKAIGISQEKSGQDQLPTLEEELT